MQDHGVGDVGHVEFVKADQAVALGHFLAQHIQRVHRALHGRQFTVHLAHELVKMQTGLALDRHGFKKAVHQEALAAPHPAEHVDALGNLRLAEQLLDRVGAFDLERTPLLGATLKRLDGAQLGRVALEATLLQLFFVNGTNGHGL